MREKEIDFPEIHCTEHEAFGFMTKSGKFKVRIAKLWFMGVKILFLEFYGNVNEGFNSRKLYEKIDL